MMQYLRDFVDIDIDQQESYAEAYKIPLDILKLYRATVKNNTTEIMQIISKLVEE